MTTVITIDAGDQISSSRTDLNTSLANLNSDKIETSVISTDSTFASASDFKIASQLATKTYVDTGGNVNASTTTKGIVEEATAAEITAGTATGGTGARLFINPTAVAETGAEKIVKIKSTGKIDATIIPSPTVAHGNTTKNISTTTTTTIAHGMSAAPSIVRIKGVIAPSGGVCETYATYMNGTQVHAVLWGDTGTGTTEYTQASFALLFDSTPHGLSGAISVDATNITITWSDFPGSSLPSVTAVLMWEAQL